MPENLLSLLFLLEPNFDKGKTITFLDLTFPFNALNNALDSLNQI